MAAQSSLGETAKNEHVWSGFGTPDSGFQVRRISWAAQQLLASGLPLAEWRIRRKGWIGKKLGAESGGH